MSSSRFNITEIDKKDGPLVAAFVAASWGSPMSVSRGRIFNTSELPGLVYKEGEKIAGLLIYRIEDGDCEIVTLNSHLNKRGLASQLIDRVIQKAKTQGCKRVWLITTNDNTNAIRYYQKRGFEWVGFHKDSMKESRKLKPEIPERGEDDIPIKHEIEFEFRL